MRRDCGIRLHWLHPADEGSWTVRVGNVGEPTVDLYENFTISITGTILLNILVSIHQQLPLVFLDAICSNYSQ
jgi:hypothetical protein